jgi:hypothetical protein
MQHSGAHPDAGPSVGYGDLHSAEVNLPGREAVQRGLRLQLCRAATAATVRGLCLIVPN